MTKIVVTPLAPADRTRWAELWRGYLEFYGTSLPPELYDHTWQRLIALEGPIRGLGARCDSAAAPLVGITHYLFHAHSWTAREVCYLQDLFVDPTARRHGIGAKLIEAVAAIARERGCLRLYWTTKEDNAVARSLYDRIAHFTGFIRGDASEDSDYDIAVFIKDPDALSVELHQLAAVSTDLLVDTGSIISAKPFLAGTYREQTGFMHDLRRDGIDL